MTDEDARFEAFAQQLDEDARFEAFSQQLTALCNAVPYECDVIVISGLFAELAERIAASVPFSDRDRAVQQFADHLRQYIAEIPPDA